MNCPANLLSCAVTFLSITLLSAASAQDVVSFAPDTAIVYRVFGHPPPVSRQCAEVIAATDMGFEWRALGSGCIVSHEFVDSIATLNVAAEKRLVARYGPHFWALFHERVETERVMVNRIDSLARRAPVFQRSQALVGNEGMVLVWVERDFDGGYNADIIPVRQAPAFIEAESRLVFDQNGVLRD